MKFQLLIILLKKNVLEGEPAIMPIDFFEEKTPQIKEFVRNHRNTKIKMIMVRLMDKSVRTDQIKKPIFIQDKAYFHSDTYINPEKMDIKNFFFGMIYEYWMLF